MLLDIYRRMSVPLTRVCLLPADVQQLRAQVRQVQIRSKFLHERRYCACGLLNTSSVQLLIYSLGQDQRNGRILHRKVCCIATHHYVKCNVGVNLQMHTATSQLYSKMFRTVLQVKDVWHKFRLITDR